MGFGGGQLVGYSSGGVGACGRAVIVGGGPAPAYVPCHGLRVFQGLSRDAVRLVEN